MSTFVVTGASSGIGRATAHALAAAGHHVFATVRKEQDAASFRTDERITPLFLDVTSPDQIAAAVDTVGARVGDAGLDGLINNAGTGSALPMELMQVDELRRQLEVNTIGQLAVTQAFLPLLRQAQGRIVMIGSIGVRATPPFTGPIVVPKAALTAATHALRQELAGSGIRTILVDPATIHTDAGDKLARDAERIEQGFSTAERSRYGTAFHAMASRFVGMHAHGSRPEVVADTIVRALTTRRPRARYTVGKNALPLSVIARLPIPLADALRRRVFGLPSRPSSAGPERQGRPRSLKKPRF
jgi:NAD(P)-dependent dehydrogenase (short-subunit alcohol dehydrogenase family)